MRTLVVGSKGFIGSRLLSYLSQTQAKEIWGCDVVNDYTAKNYLVIDAGNSNFEEVFIEHTFDICINCSGSASVSDSLLHPTRDFYLNTLNVFNLLEAIRKHSPDCKFLNISSAAVYGNPLILPIKENALLQPISPYGFHKLQAENICQEYYQFHNIQSCSIRVFSAYGNGLKKQIFWDIAQKLINKEAVALYGTGNESRDFIHVDDIIKAIEIIIKKGEFNAAHYNVANGEEVTIKLAAQKMQFLLGYKDKLSFTGNQRKGDPLNWRADITRLTDLGYQQNVSIDEGLIMYIKWLKEEKLA